MVHGDFRDAYAGMQNRALLSDDGKQGTRDISFLLAAICLCKLYTGDNRNFVYLRCMCDCQKHRVYRSAKNESKKQARLLDSPLRRVYFSLLLLISLFNLIPAIYTAIIDYLDLGFFKNLSEFLTFIKPFLQIIIFGAVGFFLMLFIGKRLCRYQNKLIRREHLDAESKQYEETIHVES